MLNPRMSLGSRQKAELCVFSRRNLIATIVLILTPFSVVLASDAGGHRDPILPVLLALIVILAAAKLGGEIMERLRMPAVLGELLAGVFLGNLVLFNSKWNLLEPLRMIPFGADWAVIVGALAQLGVIILLFDVGLESTVRGMMKVGASSLLVAILGVLAPFALGFASWLFIRQVPPGLAAIVPAGFNLGYVHMFVGAVLCATSVGITARVFKDLNRLQTREAQIILGAAVIDDVLGLIVLAVVSSIVASAESGRAMSLAALLRLVSMAMLFLFGSLAAGTFFVPRVMKFLSRLRSSGIALFSCLLFAFALSYLAGIAGLAPIVGAFAAGLLLEEVHFSGFRENIRIEELIRPVSAFLAPIFFVLMGIQVRLETFADLQVLGIAAGLTIAAILGKQVCGFGVLEKGLHRVTVGVGMIPRGEVGLIFAGIGKSLRVIDDGTFSALVIMVVITTLITPPLLQLTFPKDPIESIRQK
jgi:Kef-type K+ transport system membrane component KefB